MCILTPQSIEGPFYLDPHLVRREIAEDRKGVPLRVMLRVIEAGLCTPLATARVDIWHADARGIYSGYDAQGDGRNISTAGQKFLRGTQFTDDGGWVSFDTIYPGWYAGRATHIHFKVFLKERTVLMGQIYFPDALSEFIYTQVSAYKDRATARDVVNANDMIANPDDPQRLSFCAIKEERDRYVATLILGVDRNGAARADRPGPPPPPRGRNGPPPGPPAGGPLGFLPLGDRIEALIPRARSK
jgi:protocatechuate 3,4-dioxygenase beta subunit